MSLKSPSKHLRYSETNFSGYWVQLNAVIRHNDHADQVLDGLLSNPLLLLHNLPTEEDLFETLKACYEANNYEWPPTPAFVDNDPIAAYKQFKIATTSLQGQNETVQEWMTTHGESLDAYRAGVKFIYEKAVATLDSSESAMLVADLNYGSGMALLHRLKNKQQRQTSQHGPLHAICFAHHATTAQQRDYHLSFQSCAHCEGSVVYLDPSNRPSGSTNPRLCTPLTP